MNKKYILYGLVSVFVWSGSFAFGKCISSWSEIDQLGSSVRGINLSQVQSKGTIQFKLSEGNKTFTLMNYLGQIYAKSPDGNAVVSLCEEGGALKAVAHLGLFGKREAKIKSLGAGNFQINTKANVYKASVVR